MGASPMVKLGYILYPVFNEKYKSTEDKSTLRGL